MALEDHTPVVPLGLKLELFALQNPDVRTIPLTELLAMGLMGEAEKAWAVQPDVLLETVDLPEDLPGSVRFNFRNHGSNIVWSAPSLRTAERMTVSQVQGKISERAAELGRQKHWRVETQGLEQPNTILITDRLFFAVLPRAQGDSRIDQILRIFEQHSLPPPKCRYAAVSVNIRSAPPQDWDVLAQMISEVLRLGFGLPSDQSIEIAFGW